MTCARQRQHPIRSAGLSAVAVASGLALVGVTHGRHQARAAVFDSQAISGSNVAVLAQPVGENSWKLLVLEQLRPSPACWVERPGGVVEPALNSFDFKGICSRYLDSNGYSLRLGDEDLSARYRLKVVATNRELQLQAINADVSVPLLLGRAPLPQDRSKDGFVKLNLESDWALERRTYQGKALAHVYFAHDDSADALVARARAAAGQTAARSGGGSFTLKQPIRAAISPGRRSRSEGPVALQVIPYRR